MTDHQHELAQALGRCRFSAGTATKRFARWASEQPRDRELSAKAAAFLERLGHSYRLQLGRCMAKCCDVCNATARPCPSCGAKAGKPCRTKQRPKKRLARGAPPLIHASRLERTEGATTDA